MRQIKLDYLSATRVCGNDAESFLQAQLTADLSKLSEGNACFSAFCHPTGNTLAVLLVLKGDDGFVLIASADLMDGLIDELSRFVLRADVGFERLETSVSGCPDTDEPKVHECISARPTSLRYCIADSPSFSNDILDADNWRALELKAGLVWLSQKTSGKFLPQMLGVDKLDGLSFRKGCFPGQEVIARVRYLGKLKQRPVIVEIAADLKLTEGAKLNVLGNNDLNASAIVVACVSGSDETILYLVARVAEGSTINAIRVHDREIELKEPVQA